MDIWRKAEDDLERHKYMNIKDDEYINSFDIKNVEDIDHVIDFMKGKKSLATWKEAIKKISEIDSYIDTIAKDRRPYIPKDIVWVTILEQYLSKIEKCYELIQKTVIMQVIEQS